MEIVPGPGNPEDQEQEQPEDEPVRNPATEYLKRRIVRSVEQEYDVTLSPEEREILLNSYFSGGLDDVSTRANEIFQTFRSGMISNISQENGAISIKEPGRFDKWLKKYLPSIKRIGVTAAASMAIRTVLHLIPGVGYVAGTITGMVIGGISGKLRAEEGARKEGYGYNGVVQEYNNILADESDPDRQKTALAFLQSFLMTGGKNEKFTGNLPDLLKLLVFYTSKAREIGDLNLSEINLNEGILRSVEFRQSVKGAIEEAGIAGMKKGALIGAGIGFASDVIAFGAHWLRSEHLRNEYIDQHHGADNEVMTRVDPDVRIPPDQITYNPLKEFVRGDQTDWSSALSKVIKDGLADGKFQIPQAYENALVQQYGFTHDRVVEQFVHDFSLAQALPEHASTIDGLSHHFNIDGIKQLINDAIVQNPDGTLDYARMGEALNHADQFLTENFPAQGFDYTLHHQYPFEQGMLYDRAVDFASERAGESALESLAHGAGIGAGISFAQSRAEKAGGGQKGALAGRSGDGGTAETAQAQAEATPPATPAPETPPRQVEPEVPTEPITWADVLKSNKVEFETKANATLFAATKKDWANMSQVERNNIIGLFNTISANNNRANPTSRFKIKLYDGADAFLVQAPTPNSAIFSLNQLNGNPANQTLDLTNRREDRITIAMEENGLPQGFTPDTNRFNPTSLSGDLTMYNPVSDKTKFKVELTRQMTGPNNQTPTPIWEGDPVDRGLEITGVNPTEGTLTLLDSRGNIHTIPAERLATADQIKIYQW